MFQGLARSLNYSTKIQKNIEICKFWARKVRRKSTFPDYLFGSVGINAYICTQNNVKPEKRSAMCTVTLSYDQNNALARRKLAALLATGLFLKKDFQPDDEYKPTPEAIEAHRKLRDAALELSRKNMSHIIARYV